MTFISVPEWFKNLYTRSPNTAITYQSVLKTLLRDLELTDVELIDLAKINLEELEFRAEQWAKKIETLKSGSYLNNTYGALKDYLYENRIIKDRRFFRKYTSKIPRGSVFDEKMLEFNDVKRMIVDYAEGPREKIIAGLYTFGALRPLLAPQVFLRHCEVKIGEGNVTVTKPMMIMIPRTSNDNHLKRRLGNKGNIDFITFAKSEISGWVEQDLNDRIKSGETLTPESVLVPLSGNTLRRKKESIDYVIRKLYAKIGFENRPYLCRHFGDRFLSAMNDFNLKEWMMGHKGRISAIYDFGHGLTKEAIEEYRAKYLIADRKYPLLGLTDAEHQKVETVISFAQNVAELNPEQIEALKLALNKGKLTIKQFEEQIQELTRKALKQQTEKQFEKMFVEMNHKYNGSQ